MAEYCPDCKTNTEVVIDHHSGSIICTECALVLDAQIIDDTCEWRNFADDTSGDRDPSRVGAATNPLFDHSVTQTVVRKSNRASTTGASLPPSLFRGSVDPDRALVLAFKAIDAMSDALGLDEEPIRYRAKEIYKKVGDRKAIGRVQNQKQNAATLAACLYIGCQQENKPRTLKEIYSVANGARKKEIRAAKDYIVKQLELTTVGTINAGDVMRRFCSNLGVTNFHTTVKAAQEVLEKSAGLDIRRSPVSIAAAVIYVVTQLSSQKKPLEEVAMATGVAIGTIRHSYKDLYPHLGKIIPSWYARQEDLKNLSCP